MPKRRILYALQAGLLGLLLGLLASSRTGYRVEAPALDRFFGWRYSLFGSRPIHPDLILVGVDAATIDGFGKPEIFWQSDLGELVSKIQQGGPKAVGLDLLIAPKVVEMAPDDPVRRRLEDEGRTRRTTPTLMSLVCPGRGFFFWYTRSSFGRRGRTRKAGKDRLHTLPLPDHHLRNLIHPLHHHQTWMA